MSLFVYVAFALNTKVIISRNIVTGDSELLYTDIYRIFHRRLSAVFRFGRRGSSDPSADGIITDNVTQAVEMAEELEKWSDVDRMVDKIKTVL